MVNAGEINIVARVDTSAITAGLNTMRQGLESAKTHAKSTFADMERLGASIGTVGTAVGRVGLALGGTFLGLATLGPQVAPFLARMAADTQRLTNILGEQLAPVFESVSNKFSTFVDWLDQGGAGVDAFLASVATLATSAGVATLLKLVGLSSATPYVIPIVASLAFVATGLPNKIGNALGELTNNLVGDYGSGGVGRKAGDALMFALSPLVLLGGAIYSLLDSVGLKPEGAPTFSDSLQNLNSAGNELFGLPADYQHGPVQYWAGKRDTSPEEVVRINQQMSQEDVTSLAYRNANIR